MKKTLAAVAAFLFLLCAAEGCMQDQDTTNTTMQTIGETIGYDNEDDTSTETESVYTTEYTSAAETAAETSDFTVSQSEITASAAQTTTSQAKTTTTAPPAETATTAAEAQTQPGTTRQSLIDQWRSAIDQRTAPKADPAFFNDAVFVGDSVTLGLRNYTTAQRNKGKDCLGTAQFLCFGSMSYTNTIGSVSAESMHPTYKGKKVRIEDGVQLCGAKKVFIMLGMNDFAAYSEKEWKQNVKTQLDRIRSKNPDVAIYLESVTPILSGMEHGRFNNDNIRQFNAYLKQVCDERSYTYVDIYHVLSDESGHLKKSYCGDPGAMGIHMSNEGSAAWVQYLTKTFCGE